MTDRWVLRYPYTKPPLLMNTLRTMHWRKKYDLEQMVQKDTMTLCRFVKVPRLERAHVTVTYTPAQNRKRDSEGLVATQKPMIDGLVKAGLLRDDTPEFITWAQPLILPADKNDPHMTLIIERR